MKFLIKVIILFLILPYNLGASDFQISKEAFKNSSDRIPAVKTPSVEKQDKNLVGDFIDNFINTKKTKKITVMVYINAKNDLELAGLYNVNQMEKVGSSSKVNIIVEFGRMNGQSGDTDLDGNWIGVRRYYIKKDKDPNKITSPIVYKKEGKNVYDMGDYKNVINFVKWTKEHYPAERYMLILWDHGTGWLDFKRETSEKGISFDDETGNYITTEEIGKILKATGKIDILAFDACLMQTAEVLYEVKDYTDIVIGSEETIPALGYPYEYFLAKLIKNPELSNREIATMITREYDEYYQALNKAVTLSAVDAKKIDRLVSMLKEFKYLLLNSKNIAPALSKAKKEVLRFDILGSNTDPRKELSFFGDLTDFISIIYNNTDDENLKSKIREIKNFITSKLVISTGNNDRDVAVKKSYEFAYGISIYIPPADSRLSMGKIDSMLVKPYSQYNFAKASGWDKVVKFIYEKTKN